MTDENEIMPDVNMINYMRKSSALKIVQHLFNDTVIKKASERLRELSEDTIKNHLKEHLSKDSSLVQKHKDDKDVQRDIFQVLNFLETISVGIKYKIYDETILKETIHSGLIFHYKKAKPAIDYARKEFNNHSIFENLEEIAKKWDSG